MSMAVTMESLSAICDVVSDRTGLWLGPAARRRMESILLRRIAAGNYRTISEYYHFLRDDPFGNGELAKLASLVTTRKPRLMNPDVSELVGRFAETRAAQESPPPAVLAVGTAAADDIYTAAMVLSGAGVHAASMAAADIDLDRLLRGADGVYTNRAAADVSAPDLDEHFDPLPGARYRAKPGLRDNVGWLFANPLAGWIALRHSRLYDLIICREFLNRLTFSALETWARPHDLLAPSGMLICDRRLYFDGRSAVQQLNSFWLCISSHDACSCPAFVQQSTDHVPRAACFDATNIPEQEDVGQAERPLLEAVGNDPSDARHRIALAMLLLHKGNAADAQEHALAALSLGPHSPHALLACGMVYEGLNRLRTAEQFYRKALLVRPTMPAAQHCLAELRTKVSAREEQYVHA